MSTQSRPFLLGRLSTQSSPFLLGRLSTQSSPFLFGILSAQSSQFLVCRLINQSDPYLNQGFPLGGGKGLGHTNGWTDEQKKPGVEVGAPPKKD